MEFYSGAATKFKALIASAVVWNIVFLAVCLSVRPGYILIQEWLLHNLTLLLIISFIRIHSVTRFRYRPFALFARYGITKSRLGTAYRRIVWICVVYLVFCLLDAGLRAFHPRFRPSLAILLGGLPMIAVDLAILWWSFSYLLSTLRETRVRRNQVKYRLYRIFSGLLITVAVSKSLEMLKWDSY